MFLQVRRKSATVDFVFGAFQMQMCACIALLLREASDAAVVSCCVPVHVFRCETEELERLGECTKSVLSACVTTKLEFVSVLNIQSQRELHCTLLKSRTQQAPP